MPHTRPLRISRIACWAAIALSAVTLGAIAPLVAHAKPLAVTIIHLNDWDRMGDGNGQGGGARIASVVKTERARVEAAGGQYRLSRPARLPGHRQYGDDREGRLQARLSRVANARYGGDFGRRGVGGRFPQVAGLSFSFDVRRPPGSRVTRIEVAGAPLDEARTYTVATNDFMHTGGDGYTVLGSGEILIDAASGDTMANHLIEYVRAAGTVAPVIEGRIIRED